MIALLGTVARGLRSRLLLSIGSVVLVALAVGSAVLGPVFQQAVTGSFLVTRLADAPNDQTGLSWSYRAGDRAGRTADLEGVLDAAEQRASEAAGDPGEGFAPPQTFVRTDRLAALGAAEVRLGWKADQCADLDVEGRCPAAPDEVLVMTADAELTGLEVGDRFTVEGYGDVRVVGSYAVPSGDQLDAWFEASRLQTSPAIAANGQPYRPAPFLTTAETIERVAAAGGGYEVLVDRRLDVPASLDPARLDALVEVAAAQQGLDEEDPGGALFVDRSINDLAGVAAEVREQQATARSSVAPAVVSLVLVALALLLRLLTAAADLRRPELALASLRGLPRRRMWALGLSEPGSLLLLALPAGAVLGVLSALGLVRAWLVPGLPLRVPAAAWLAGLGVAVGAAAVAVAATGLVLRTSLSDQLAGVPRPRRAKRLAVLAEVVLVAAAAAILLSKLSAEGTGRPDATDLALPVLLALVAGLAATRGLAWAAGWWTRALPHGRGLGSFVAARALSRRREGILVVLPVTAAIAICVFGAGVYDSASSWRASVAATRAPGDVVWTSPQSLAATTALSRRVDPDGQWLMAAGTLATPSPGPVFSIVDSARLPRVARWSDQWTPGTSVEEVADALALPTAVPVLTGSELTLGVDNDARTSRDLTVRLRLVPAGERAREVFLGPFPRGERSRTADVGFCADGCTLDGLTLGGPAALRTEIRGTVTLSGLEVDGEPRPDALDDAGWSVALDASSPDAVDAVVGDDGTLRVEARSSDEVIVQLSAGDLPDALPVLQGVDASTEQAADAFTTGSPLTFPVAPVRTAESVPLLGPRGLLIDVDTLSTDREVYDQDTEVYVLSRADTPPAVQQALREAGLTRETTLEETRADLDSTAYALALRLYAVVALLVLVMAVASLAVSTAVQLPARRRDAAALRVVGVPRRQGMGAVLRELVVVLGSTAVAGLAAGSLAQYVVLRTVTLGYAETLSTPALVAAIDLGRLAVLAGATGVLFGAVALFSAVLTVRGARGSTLRETVR